MNVNESQFREKVTQTLPCCRRPDKTSETNVTDETAGRIWTCGVRHRDINVSLSCLPGLKVKTLSLKLFGIFSRFLSSNSSATPTTPSSSNFCCHYDEHTIPKYLCHHLHKQMMYEGNLYRYKNGFFDVVAAPRTYGNDLSFYDLLNTFKSASRFGWRMTLFSSLLCAICESFFFDGSCRAPFYGIRRNSWIILLKNSCKALHKY